jgi:hypothetical protein
MARAPAQYFSRRVRLIRITKSNAIMITIKIIQARSGKKISSRVWLKPDRARSVHMRFEQGLPENLKLITTATPKAGFRFIQIRLTFHEQGLLKIFQSKSVQKNSSKVWLIRIDK